MKTCVCPTGVPRLQWLGLQYEDLMELQADSFLELSNRDTQLLESIDTRCMGLPPQRVDGVSNVLPVSESRKRVRANTPCWWGDVGVECRVMQRLGVKCELESISTEALVEKVRELVIAGKKARKFWWL